ncbi:hypothetical protein CDIK_3097 [Cucumispora dikerogammari]|nr:hypothetical protein CDIK_3097 [Cucumispora dikerogammari]
MFKGTELVMKYLTQYVLKYIVKQHKIDYKHETGPGVRVNGIVHKKTNFKVRCFFSVESGIYVKDTHGIRIEDVESYLFIKTNDSFQFYRMRFTYIRSLPDDLL